MSATALVLRALGLGDLLTAVPALRGLRAALPGHHIRLAAPDRFQPLLQLSDTIDSVADTHEPDVLRPPEPDRPDIAVNLHGCGPGSHRYLLAREPRRLVAFANAALDVAGPGFTPDEHEVHRWCRLVEESFGVACDPDLLDLRTPAVPPPVAGAAVVHPGAAHRSRQWPPERFGSVARELRRRGLQIVITGDALDRDAARTIAASAGVPEGQILAGTTDLLQLAAQIATAPVVISGDTGVAHLASAYRRPSVTLCGPISPALWGPPPPPECCAEAVERLADRGWDVLVTGGPDERDLTKRVAGHRGRDLGGRTDLAQLAALVRGAAALVVGNTGPAQLAATVGTPVVSLFAPVVPARRWAPYRVPHVLLGDQQAPCRGTRARVCPVPGHPCLSSVTAEDAVEAAEKLVGAPV